MKKIEGWVLKSDLETVEASSKFDTILVFRKNFLGNNSEGRLLKVILYIKDKEQGFLKGEKSLSWEND